MDTLTGVLLKDGARRRIEVLLAQVEEVIKTVPGVVDDVLLAALNRVADGRIGRVVTVGEPSTTSLGPLTSTARLERAGIIKRSPGRPRKLDVNERDAARMRPNDVPSMLYVPAAHKLRVSPALLAGNEPKRRRGAVTPEGRKKLSLAAKRRWRRIKANGGGARLS